MLMNEYTNLYKVYKMCKSSVLGEQGGETTARQFK